MKPKFKLAVNSIAVANELPGVWPDEDCLALLKQLEFDDAGSIPSDQLRDYAAMALQDLEEDGAAQALVDFVFGDILAAGKRQNLAEEMTQDRLWEEYPDLSCHERIFNAQFLLNQAFPATPQPEIHRVEMTFSAMNQAAEANLQARASGGSGQEIPEALLVRCLTAALPDGAILCRLFEDQIEGKAKFTEAEHILWKVSAEPLPPEGDARRGFKLCLYVPIRWIDQLEEGTEVECEPFVREAEDQ